MIKGHFIGGQWQSGSIAKPNINPSDLSDVVGEYVEGGAAEAAQAIAAARTAFPGWSNASPQVRFDVLDKAGTLIAERREELGRLPFGGVKGSNYGPREQGSYARVFYTTVKTVYVA